MNIEVGLLPKSHGATGDGASKRLGDGLDGFVLLLQRKTTSQHLERS